MTTTRLTTPPSPVAATDEAGFVAELRRLKTWSGLSYRQLERQASAAGDSLPASTAATMLGKNRLPREELLETFLRACGLDDDELRPWLTTRTAIADGPVVLPRPVPRWRRAVVAAAALAVAFAGGAALTGGGENVEEDTVVVTR